MECMMAKWQTCSLLPLQRRERFLAGDSLVESPVYEAKIGFLTGGGGSAIVKVPGDVPPTGVFFFGPLV